MTSFFNRTNKFDGFSNWFINVHRFLLYYSNNNNNNGKEREREYKICTSTLNVK